MEMYDLTLPSSSTPLLLATPTSHAFHITPSLAFQLVPHTRQGRSLGDAGFGAWNPTFHTYLPHRDLFLV